MSRRDGALKMTRREALKLMATATAVAALGSNAAMALIRPRPSAVAKNIMQVSAADGEKLVPTTCGICRNHCLIMVRAQDGVQPT